MPEFFFHFHYLQSHQPLLWVISDLELNLVIYYMKVRLSISLGLDQSGKDSC